MAPPGIIGKASPIAVVVTPALAASSVACSKSPDSVNSFTNSEPATTTPVPTPLDKITSAFFIRGV